MALDFDPSVDHYKVLGVDPKASADEIKKVYRRLAKQNHPDSTGGDKAKEARFKEINNAYDVLSDAKKRQQYDAIRQGGFSPGGGASPFSGGFPGGARPGGPDMAWDLGDLFGQFFAGGGPGRGGGRVRVERFDFGGDADMDDSFFRGASRGGGARTRTRRRDDDEFESKVQLSDGSWARVDNGDVHSELRIPFDRAILGTVADIATVDGKASVKIPPGTSSGKKLRLRGKGVVGAAGAGGASGQVGDHYVTVQIDVPRELDDEAKRLLVELTQRIGKARKRT